MEELSKLSIYNISKKAGVKIMSEQCVDVIRNLIEEELDKLIYTTVLINENKNLKTIMPEDIFNSLHFMGENVTKTNKIMNKKNN